MWTSASARGGPLAIGKSTGQPGEVVEVPLIVTIERPVAFFSIHFEFDAERLEFLGVNRVGTDAENLDPLGISTPSYGPGAAAYLVVSPVHLDEPPRIPVGVVGELEGFQSPEVHCLDQGIWIMEIGDVRAPVNAERVSVPVFVTTCIPVMGLDCCLDTDMSRFGVVVDRDLGLHDAVKGPEMEWFAVGSTCPGGGGPTVGLIWDVLLERTSSQSSDAFEVERNGALIAEIPGASTEYLDEDIPAGVYTYKIVAITEGNRPFPASVFVSTITPPGAFLRGDPNRDAAVNIGDPVATLRFLFLGGAPLLYEDAADADDDGRLTITDLVLTLRYLFVSGAVLPTPGTRYAWFDPTTDGLSCRG